MTSEKILTICRAIDNIRHIAGENGKAFCDFELADMLSKILKLEGVANRTAVAYCNGDIDSDEWELSKEDYTEKINDIFGFIPHGFFINGDPRGFTLKIDNEDNFYPNAIFKDMGGYIHLAPEI